MFNRFIPLVRYPQGDLRSSWTHRAAENSKIQILLEYSIYVVMLGELRCELIENVCRIP